MEKLHITLKAPYNITGFIVKPKPSLYDGKQSEAQSN